MRFSKSGQDTVYFNGIINWLKCSYNFNGFGIKKKKTWSIKKVIFVKNYN
jgi:hypothetical protein